MLTTLSLASISCGSRFFGIRYVSCQGCPIRHSGWQSCWNRLWHNQSINQSINQYQSILHVPSRRLPWNTLSCNTESGANHKRHTAHNQTSSSWRISDSTDERYIKCSIKISSFMRAMSWERSSARVLMEKYGKSDPGIP